MKLRLLTCALLLLLWVAPAVAQGCAMCYSTAAAASKDGQRAINRAVLVLLVPPVGFMTLGIGMAMRYSQKRDEDANRTYSSS
jgi:cytochrome c-type biogenesis protein CcmH/NrfF